MLAGIGGVVAVLHDGDGPLPRGGVAWVAALFSTLLIMVSGSLLALTLSNRPELKRADDGMDVPAANFRFTLLADGASREIDEFRGRVLLINFWATWCQPCITELPELDQLQRDYREQGLVVVTVSDESPQELTRYTDLLPKETVSGYFDAASLPQPYRAALDGGRPISYIVDRAGILRRLVVGAGDYASFERMVTPYLRASGGAL